MPSPKQCGPGKAGAAQSRIVSCETEGLVQVRQPGPGVGHFRVEGDGFLILDARLLSAALAFIDDGQVVVDFGLRKYGLQLDRRLVGAIVTGKHQAVIDAARFVLRIRLYAASVIRLGLFGTAGVFFAQRKVAVARPSRSSA